MTYSDLKVVGNGSFGVVFLAKLQNENNEQVEMFAICIVIKSISICFNITFRWQSKKCCKINDLKTENCKLCESYHIQISLNWSKWFDYLLMIDSLIDTFSTLEVKKRTNFTWISFWSKCFPFQKFRNEIKAFINEFRYVPETVYRVARHYIKQRQQIPMIYVKLYMYQLFKALAYIHGIGWFWRLLVA